MHVCIVGAGVIGLTTAWYLRQSGHQVTVVEQHDKVAQEASWGNGGQLSSGLCAPWAAPGAVRTALSSFLHPQGPLRIRPKLSWAQWRWFALAARASSAQRFNSNRQAMQTLAAHSLSLWHQLREALPLQFDQLDDGIVLTVQTAAQMQRLRPLTQALQQAGRDVQLLDTEQLLALEPGLQHSHLHFPGALHLRDESSGNSASFAQQLAKHLQVQAVQLLLGTEVYGLAQTGKEVHALQTSRGSIQADCYVLACGAQTQQLLKGELSVPVYPVKGYSLTAKLRQPSAAVQAALLDEQDKVSFVRFGDSVRITAFAEFDGYPSKFDHSRIAQLRTMYEARFPGSADLDSAQAWQGYRPMSPDGPPLIGATRLSNLYLNTGQGTFGWTMACGSAHLLNQLLNKQTPSIDPKPYCPQRYTSPHTS